MGVCLSLKSIKFNVKEESSILKADETKRKREILLGINPCIYGLNYHDPAVVVLIDGKEGGMNIAEKMEIESRLMTNLADWMEKHGRVVSDRQQSNAHTGVRIREIIWRGNTYQIVDVDGMTCRIERL